MTYPLIHGLILSQWRHIQYMGIHVRILYMEIKLLWVTVRGFQVTFILKFII